MGLTLWRRGAVWRCHERKRRRPRPRQTASERIGASGGAHRAIGIKMTAKALGARELKRQQLALRRVLEASNDRFSSIAGAADSCTSHVASATISCVASASASATAGIASAATFSSSHVATDAPEVEVEVVAVRSSAPSLIT